MSDLDYIFHPQSVAIVGASPSDSSLATKYFLKSLIQFGYEGKIYPVHPKIGEVFGLKAYPNILDIPGSLDYVICAIKAALTPQLVKECITKKVKSISLFTSGFSETGEEEGIRLEKELVEIARRGNLRIIGPNCMGLYCPSSRISYDTSFPKESGGVGFLCQSGGNSIEGVQIAAAKGVRFSKVVSFGNASDLNEADFMEYLTHDSQTKVIGGYIEGTKDGRRFINALREAVKVKPVILIKGGMTEAGTKAVASHTGALAGNSVIWNSLFHQLGVIQVHDLEDLVDVLLLFQHLKPFRGRKAGLVGSGGGRSILATDSCEREGLLVPSFSQELTKKLREIIPGELDPGTSVRNPVDFSSSGWNGDIFPQILKTVANYEDIDVILTYIRATYGVDIVNRLIDSLVETKRSVDKPIAMVICQTSEPEVANLAFNLQQRCHQAGIPVFPSFSRAAHAISKFIQYYEVNV